ncbi:MAG: TonB-dependent receptor [Prolixibacteraceae bacterium]|nr:TonB-dependent receptor [Prolixibacteraceae bacterium]
MRLTLFCFLLALFGVQASSYSQNTRFNFKYKNTSIKQILEDIKSQSEFEFFYSNDDFDTNAKVDLKISNATVEEVLQKIVDPTSLKYSVIDKTVVISNVKAKELNGSQQEKSVKGTVKDASGAPIPGVSVVVKGTTRGSLSDQDGNYSITDVTNSTVLQFSFVGMNTKDVAVGNQSIVNITLEENTIGIEEVVAIGYGAQKKRDISTAISSVSSDDLKDKPVSNFAQAISGKMAGVRISNTNAAPGGGTNIVIRGVSSINASNSPLVVIDGFPMKDGFNKNDNPLNSINPADIESIEVLKDASSSAIYGTQAANGVILITTKKGKSGKPTINVNVSTGMQQMINKIDVLNREDFLKYMDDARANAYIIEDPNFGTNNTSLPLWQWTDSNATRIANWAKYSQHASAMAQPGAKHARWITVSDATKAMPYDTNWQDVITQTGKVNDVQISATGGTDNVSYMVSGGYFDQEGIVPTSGYNRFSFRANVDLKINDNVKFGLLLAPSIENLDVLSNTEGGSNSNPFFNAVAMPPILNARDDNGVPVYWGTVLDNWADWNLNTFVNPLHQFMKQDNRRTAKNLSTLYGEINILKDLKFRSEFHTEFRYWEQNFFLPNATPTASQTFSRSQGINQTSTRLYWNSQNFLTYQKNFGKHAVTAMAGYSTEESSYRSNYINKYDYPTDLITTLNQATTILNSQNDARTNRSGETMIGSFGRVMYNYGGKYYFTGSVRRDGSSRFGQDNKWGIFPSMSVAWRASDESFFEPMKKYISDLKIRGGWGVIGNAGIANYLALSTLNSTSYVLGQGSTVTAGYVDGKVANSKLGWETTTDYSAGADMQFLNSRITFSLDYFSRETTDMLFNMPLPTITGFGSYMANIGAMRNRGFEYSINSRNLNGPLKWTTDFNLSYYRNRVLNIGKDKRPLIIDNCYTTEGKPLAGLWGMVDLGPYKNWEDVKTSPIFNASNPLWKNRSNPGTPKVADVNGDGILDASDNTIIGSSIPDFVWGMTNSFEYKGFDLSVQVNGVQGGDINMLEYTSVFGRGTGTFNTTAEYYNNYWTPTRTDAKYSAPSRKNYEGTDLSGTLVYKGTYVNIQNISFGYTLPKHLVKRASFSNIRVYSTIQNALFITKFPGFNPETNYRGDQTTSQGIDRGAYPLARTVSFGLNISL